VQNEKHHQIRPSPFLSSLSHKMSRPLVPRENPILADKLEFKHRERYYIEKIPGLTRPQIRDLVRAEARRGWSFGVLNEDEELHNEATHLNYFNENERKSKSKYDTQLLDFLESVSYRGNHSTTKT
jgi:hypothetical protein